MDTSKTDKNGKAFKGSQLHLQKLINEKSEIFDKYISEALKEKIQVDWKSPLKSDNYKEYRDSAFLGNLGIRDICERIEPLTDFWPARGSCWDALGVAGNKYFIVEAKAHLTELVTKPSGAGAKSLELINKSIHEVQTFLGIKPEDVYDWSKAFYQHANRVCHLYYLRKCGIDAHLIFLYFTGEKKFPDGTNQFGYECAETIVEYALGLDKPNPLSDYIHKIYINVDELK